MCRLRILLIGEHVVLWQASPREADAIAGRSSDRSPPDQGRAAQDGAEVSVNAHVIWVLIRLLVRSLGKRSTELDGGHVVAEEPAMEGRERDQNAGKKSADGAGLYKHQHQRRWKAHGSQQLYRLDGSEQTRRTRVDEELKEKLVVRISDGVVQPGAIMVHSQDAPLRSTAVVGAIGLVRLGLPAPTSLTRLFAVFQRCRWTSERSPCD
mmetsp:Transcript_68396/g.163035  ORF Transcript_68396/g.163035 Transcript_68396/m.163035 type:complete len:209 (+) Transcript_68396:364-990(+)